MYASMWFMSVIALLAVDVRTGAIQPKDSVPRRCHHCTYSNTSDCGVVVSIACTTDRPRCATTAVAPDFASLLTCAAATDRPCSLTYSQQILQMTCVCPGELCNSPFSTDLRNELLNFSNTYTQPNGTIDLTEQFFKLPNFVNITDDSLYKIITTDLKEVTDAPSLNSSQVPTHGPISSTKTIPVTRHTEVEVPRAEALKHEATVPSDDDEDESEGSGSYEDTRSQRRPASAPAAPSSYLPANENRAPHVSLNILLTPLFLYFITIV